MLNIMNFNCKIVLSVLLSFFFLTSCQSKKNSKEFPQFENARIGVLVGTSYESFIANNYKDADLYCLDNNADLYLALNQGKIDYLMYDRISFLLDTSRSKSTYTIVKDSLIAERFGMAFCKTNPELREKFNAFLQKSKADSTYQKMLGNWLLPYAKNEMPNLNSIPRSGQPLKVAVSGTYANFDMIIDERNVGFDIEMMERFAAYLGRPIEFDVMNFSSMIPAVVSGKCDAAACCMAITKERSAQVDFSDPYLISYGVGVSLKENVETKKIRGENHIYFTKDDFTKSNIGVMTGSSQDIYATANFPKAIISRAEIPTLVGALMSNKCDVVLLPSVQAQEVVKSNDKLVILKEDFSATDIAAGFNKSNTVLQKQFNKYLRTIIEDGTLDEIENKYIDNQGEEGFVDVSFSRGNPNLPTLRVATTGSDVPYSFVSNEVLVGIDIELGIGFANSIGRYAEFSLMPFESIIPALTGGKTDIGLNQIMVTAERQNQVLFSDKYDEIRTIAVIRKENHPIYALNLNGDGSDIEQSVVGVLTGSLGQYYLEDHFPKATLKCYDDVTDAMQALSSKKIDYVFTSYTTSKIATHQLKNIFIIPRPYTNEGAAVAFRKDEDPKLIKKVNAIIQKYYDDGTMAKIEDKWVNKGGDAYTMDDVEVLKDAPVLNIAIAANREPMCFIMDGQYMGLDIELISRIATELGRKPVFHDMKFSALTASLLSKKTDLIISNFTKTPEREKKVTFSTEYFFNPQKLVARMEKIEKEKVPFFEKLKESFDNNLVKENRYKLILDGLWNTIYIALFSIILGTIIGAVVCAMRMAKSKIFSGFAKGYITLMRGTPILVFLMIIFYVVFAKVDISAVLVAVLAFAMNFAAYASEMFRTAIEGVDRGQYEAGAAMGFTPYSTFRFIILPQAVKRVMPVYTGEAISLLKMTSIVGYIAVQDLTKASDIIRSRTFDAFFPLIVITVIYFILAWLLGQSFSLISKKINKRK